MTEQWKPIPAEPNYEASDQGRIRRVVGGKGCRAGRVLKPLPHVGGYQVVNLWTDGRVRRRTIHTLVYEAFVGPRPDGMEVNHVDGVKTNNALTNLQGSTRTENQRHAVDTGLAATGSRHPRYTITPELEQRIRDASGRGLSNADIARDLSVSRTAVRRVVSGLDRFGAVS